MPRPAAVHRKLLGLHAAVPGTARQAASRADRRHPAGDRRHAQEPQPLEPGHRRHDDRGERLPEPAVRPGRRSDLLSAAASPCGATRPKCAAERLADAAGGRAADDRLRDATCPTMSRSIAGSTHLVELGYVRAIVDESHRNDRACARRAADSRRPTHGRPRSPHGRRIVGGPPARFVGDGVRSGAGGAASCLSRTMLSERRTAASDGRNRWRRLAAYGVQHGAALRRVRDRLPGARAAAVQLQPSAGCLSGVRRLRQHRGHRHGPRRARPSKSIRDGAIAPWNSPAYAHELEELLALADDYKLARRRAVCRAHRRTAPADRSKACRSETSAASTASSAGWSGASTRCTSACS